MYYLKRTKLLDINQWNGLPRKYAYFLEKICLLLLQKNYKCICQKKKYHFPKILKCNDNVCKFYLSHCGKSLLEKNISKEKHLNKEDLLEQINCIIYNLKKCNIKHYDIRASNICISDDGCLSLIDFDYASYNNLFYSVKIMTKDKQFKDNYYEMSKIKLQNIVLKRLLD